MHRSYCKSNVRHMSIDIDMEGGILNPIEAETTFKVVSVGGICGKT